MKVKLLKKLRKLFPLETQGRVLWRTYKRSWQDYHFYKETDWSTHKHLVIDLRRKNILTYLRNEYRHFRD
jgi:hypothetical protein